MPPASVFPPIDQALQTSRIDGNSGTIGANKGVCEVSGGSYLTMIRFMRKSILFTFSLLTVAIVLAVPLQAQNPVGLRAGVSADPDQFFFGGHFEAGPFMEGIRFRPNAEAGFGDNRSILSLNFEFIYPIELENGSTAYLGAGPAINVISFDRDRPGESTDTNVEPGFNFLGGLEFPNNVFAEIRVGLIDSPRVKFGFGYTFR